MKKIANSLFFRFIVLIVIALGFLQTVMILYLFSANFEKMKNNQLNLTQIEEKWTNDVKEATPDSIDKIVEKWHDQFEKSQYFYVDGQGELQKEWYIQIDESLPKIWDTMKTTRFIQEHYDAKLYTVIRFVGDKEENGFLVLQIPRDEVTPTKVDNSFIYIGGVFLILYLIISFIFFFKIIKRLVRLEKAMTVRENGLPVHTKVAKKDEIGKVEVAFNQMIDELEEAKEKQEEEEQLRKELIANLSHDLKTPLTKIRAASHDIPKENQSLIDQNIDKMSELIDNLMSYTLLTADKVTFELEENRIDRLVNQSIALWYPVFEERDFEVEVELEQTTWVVDDNQFSRVLDNVFQNVLRHADSGKYLGIFLKDNCLVIQDKGPGLEAHSENKGAGIGLNVIDLMTSKMSLSFKIESNQLGTKIMLKEKD